jgi:cobalt/nickel transport system ATP-binding protein
VHLAEGLLPAPLAAATTALALPLLAWSLRDPRRAEPSFRARQGLATALCFGCTLLPLPVPGTGLTSHLCAVPALALLLGPRAVVAPVAAVLLVEALLFAHGGLTTWGANLLTLGVIGPAAALATHRIPWPGSPSPGLRTALACAVGDLAVYASAALLLGASSPSPLRTAASVTLLLAPVQLPLALSGLPLERLVRAALALGYVTAFAQLTPPERLFVSLRAVGVPAALLDLAERGWRQGRHLAAAAIRMREGVLLRSAGAPPSLQRHGQVLGAAVDLGVRLALRSEESVVLRSAPRRESPAPAPAVQATGLGLGQRLRELQLEVGPGEVVVAGPSGSGKTTLLRLLAGLERADRGALLRFGRSLESATLAERLDARVAYLPQDPDDALVSSTALRDVAWPLELLGLGAAEADRRARAALEGLGLGTLAERPLGETSFGERKRVVLAGALVRSPALWLCDEPTSGLDPVAAESVTRQLDAISAGGASVVWVTHDLHRLPARTGRVVLLRDGCCVHQGPRSSLVPAVLRAAGLLPSCEAIVSELQ